MYKPGQLLTIDGDIYRVTKGFYACYYCAHLNDVFTPKSCNLCRNKIPIHMFPLHISMKIQDGTPVYIDNPVYKRMRKERRVWYVEYQEKLYKSTLCGKLDK